MPDFPPTPYDRLIWTDAQVEHWLVHDEHRRELVVWFGHEAWSELTDLARRAYHVTRGVGAAPEESQDLYRDGARRRVWIVPGIMGTQLGRDRAHGEPPDVLWLDPVDVIHGRLPELAWRENDGVRTLGVILHGLLRLKLRLVIAGYDARFFAYDWRESVAASAARLADAIRRDGRRCAIVAHSLGGLVARLALGRALPGSLPAIERVVLLGTPHHGAYAAVQAMRGTYAVVRRLAMLDPARTAESLAAQVFTSLPSLHDLLPRAPFAEGLDFLDPVNWPTDGLATQPALTAATRELHSSLAGPADPRFLAIAGHGIRTVLGARRSASGFTYRFGPHGDGTVALRSARVPGQPLWLARCAHSDLPRDPLVARAVVELLESGDTRVLTRIDPTDALAGDDPAARGVEEELDDAALRQTLLGKLDWASMTPDGRREFLEHLNDSGPT